MKAKDTLVLLEWMGRGMKKSKGLNGFYYLLLGCRLCRVNVSIFFEKR
jgi:hypothetical protein